MAATVACTTGLGKASVGWGEGSGESPEQATNIVAMQAVSSSTGADACRDGLFIDLWRSDLVGLTVPEA
ncbi:MAG: hypothetical protein OTJ97_05345 [SAR202 cluster bacterium]|nr:hypothetical protein [SAR202 cluster bacterium]